MIEFRWFISFLFVLILHFIRLLIFLDAVNKLFKDFVFVFLLNFFVVFIIRDLVVSLLFFSSSCPLDFSSEFVFFLDSINVVEKRSDNRILDFLFNVAITKFEFTLDELLLFVLNLDFVVSFTLLMWQQMLVHCEQFFPFFNVDRFN